MSNVSLNTIRAAVDICGPAAVLATIETILRERAAARGAPVVHMAAAYVNLAAENVRRLELAEEHAIRG